jgi:hypothetical protein
MTRRAREMGLRLVAVQGPPWAYRTLPWLQRPSRPPSLPLPAHPQSRHRPQPLHPRRRHLPQRHQRRGSGRRPPVTVHPGWARARARARSRVAVRHPLLSPCLLKGRGPLLWTPLPPPLLLAQALPPTQPPLGAPRDHRRSRQVLQRWRHPGPPPGFRVSPPRPRSGCWLCGVHMQPPPPLPPPHLCLDAMHEGYPPPTPTKPTRLQGTPSLLPLALGPQPLPPPLPRRVIGPTNDLPPPPIPCTRAPYRPPCRRRS